MSNQNQKVADVTNVKAIKVELLKDGANLKEVSEKLNEVIMAINSIKVRDRGPKSERAMTDEDAARVKFGDLKAKSHKEAAAVLGLSYGQIYSCRGGYTFNHIKDGK